MDETFGRYRLLDRLGQGGMAEVFKAKSFGVEGFEKILVIKRILPELARSKRFSDLFVHEAKLSVRLSHANIVQVFDLGMVEQTGGPTYFIAMEYVAGLDLATLLARCRDLKMPLPPGMCVYVAAEVAKGLDHAHRRRDEQMRPLGIVHRDVSPQNILISWEGEVKIADFGIAKARDSLEEEGDARAGLLHGKYPYMSPEQARGEAIDARSDIFSLGTVLYEMLTGTNPFRGTTAFETLRRVRVGEYPPVELLREDLPKGLGPLLEKSLLLAPDTRYSDAGRMYESLLAYLYASGDRFGANDLAVFVARFREKLSARPASIRPDAVVDEGSGLAQEHTPVEIPTPGQFSPQGPTERPSLFPLQARASELGERREVSALVVLLGGTRGDAVSAERRERVRDIITRYGGYLVEDEALHTSALFGLGEADGRDTETAVRCALVALRRMGMSAGSAAVDGPLDHGPSAGVHAARIIVSSDGEPQHDERLGALLAAAREMAVLRDRTCGVSISAARNVRGLFLFEAATDGKKPPPSIPGLLVSDFKTPGEGLGRFVGRKQHLKRVGEIFSLATRRHVHIITLRGEQGIGKTRLLYEIDRRLRKGEYKVAFYLATCPPSGGTIPLSGLTAMLQVLCGIKEGDSEERILEVEPRLRALGLRDEEVAAVLFQLGASGKTGSSVAALRGAVARMIVSLSSDQLHVFAWDNAHALDPQSIDIIETAIQRVGNVRAVFLFAMREAPEHALEKHANHHLLEVGHLDEAECRDLVAHRAAALIAPPELVEFCRARAKGHPLFIEELLKELIDSGALVVANGAVVELRTDGELSVPRPLRALMASRAARLPSDERRALQAAAILGEPIDLATLALMLGEPLAKAEKTAVSLEGREFVRRTGTSSITFSSPLLGEVIVDALPAEARREMHAAAAAACEAALGDGAIEQADRIANHLYEAGDRDRAAGYFARSGQRNLLGGNYDGAARETIRALELCDLARHPAAELGAWLSQLATAVYRVRVAREVPHLMDQVLAQIDRTGDLRTRVTARVDLANILVSIHELELADHYLAAAKSMAADEPRLVRLAVLTEAELARRRGDYLKALERFEEAAKLGTDEAATGHRTLTGLALAYAASGAEQRARATLASAEKFADPEDLALLCERAKLEQLIAFFSRDFAGAIEAGQKAVEMAREAGLAYEVAINLHILGEALFRNEEYPRAYACFQQSTAICDEIASERLRAHNGSYLAYLDAVTDYAGACNTLREAIEYAHAPNYSWDEVDARFLLAKLLQQKGQVEEAKAEFERCRALAQSVGLRLMDDDCRTALVELGS
ncbi:MAG TPA: protein kinase [Polyangiaceae bacterium]|nr:protein kinase [Polyangiaceae bacterium]